MPGAAARAAPPLVVAIVCGLLLRAMGAPGPAEAGAGARATYRLHQIRTVVTHGPERHAKGVEEFSFTAAVFTLAFADALTVERFDGSVTRIPLRDTDAGNATRSLRGLFSLQCGDWQVDAAAVDLATVYDRAPRIPLRWTLIPLHGHEQDKLASAIAFADRTVRERAQKPSPDRSLRVALLLHYEDDSGTLLQSSLVPPGAAEGKAREEALHTALQRCSLHVEPRDSQRLWPVGTLRVGGAEAAGALAQGFEANPAPGTGAMGVEQTRVLKVERIDKDFAAMSSHVRRNVALWRYPDEAGSWHGLVPPMPHYCGLHEGNLTRAQVQALRAHHETSFIEAAVGGGASASIPGLDAILELGMKIALGAITDPFMEQVKDHFGQAGGGQSEANNQESVPKATVQMTAPAVTYNVTNLITDAVTHHVTAAVEHSIVEEVGPDIARAVSPGLASKLESMVAPVVTEATEHSIATVAPILLSRALPLHLTRALTKSVTHALVPTLTIALTHNAHQHIWCHFCYYKHQYCNYCHDSPQSQYYTSFYGAYYADFYSNYYTEYYSQALVDIDKAQHPAAEQETARKQNLYTSGKELPLRPMTPDGSKA